jgi:ribose/xylose/arabinose/galactoside ABC-type transport system permease subunit
MNDDRQLNSSASCAEPLGQMPQLPARETGGRTQAGQDQAVWRIQDFVRRFGIYLALLLLIVVSTILSPGFLKSKNLLVLSRQASMLGIVAVGQTFVILGGGIDLSVASVMAVVSVLTANLMEGQDSRVLPISLACLALATLIGLINGTMITKFKIAPFIMTLGMILIVQGARFVYTGGAPKGSIPPIIRFWGRGLIGPIPTSVIIFILVVVVAAIVLSKTTFGRQIYAVGGNAKVAHLSGVHVDRVVIATYAICSFLAGLAGLVLTGYIGLADNWLGRGYELDSIAAVVIGGASLQGGRGNIWGTVAGVLIIAILFNIVLRLTLPEETQRIIKGATILAAVAIYSATRRQ